MPQYAVKRSRRYRGYWIVTYNGWPLTLACGVRRFRRCVDAEAVCYWLNLA